MSFLAAGALLLSAALPAGAQTTITNEINANGNWTTPAVWVGGVAPVAGGSGGDRASLTGNGGNVTVTGDVGSAGTRQAIEYLGDTNDSVTLTISNGTFYQTSFANNRAFRIGFNAPAGIGGQLILDGGNFNINSTATADTTIGANAGNGLLEVRNGNFTSPVGIQMAANTIATLAQGTLRVTGASASANIGALTMGSATSVNTAQNGRATVEVSAGGILTSSITYLDSLGSVLNRGFNGTTGSTPNAILTVNGGSYTNSGLIRFGAFTNSRARIDLTGGGVIQSQRIETANTAFNAEKLLTFNVSNGTLRVNELSLLDTQLNGGGALTIGDGTSASALELLGSANAIVVTNGIAIAANSQLRHTTAANATVASAVSGAGSLVKSGTGTLTLSAANTYSGGTTVSAGTLIVNGSVAGSTTVSGSGVLSGTGTMGGAVTVGGGGTLAIGNSPGTMTFNNDLTLELNSTSIFEINGFDPGQFDLALGGAGSQTVTFNGTLQLVFADGFNTEGSVKIFDFEAYSGSFTSVSSTGLASGYSATFDQLNGTLTVVPEPSTYAMIILAGAGLAGHLIRRRRR
jgi:fibronectin-binding autotransporter adhesin